MAEVDGRAVVLGLALLPLGVQQDLVVPEVLVPNPAGDQAADPEADLAPADGPGCCD